MYRNLCMIAALRLTTSKIYYRFISFPLALVKLYYFDNFLTSYSLYYTQSIFTVVIERSPATTISSAWNPNWKLSLYRI